MKLMNKAMAKQKLALSSGVISVEADGSVEVEDKAVISALQASGFKAAFVRKEATTEAKAESKQEEKVEAKVSTSKAEEPKKKGGK